MKVDKFFPYDVRKTLMGNHLQATWDFWGFYLVQGKTTLPCLGIMGSLNNLSPLMLSHFFTSFFHTTCLILEFFIYFSPYKQQTDHRACPKVITSLCRILRYREQWIGNVIFWSNLSLCCSTSLVWVVWPMLNAALEGSALLCFQGNHPLLHCKWKLQMASEKYSHSPSRSFSSVWSWSELPTHPISQAADSPLPSKDHLIQFFLSAKKTGGTISSDTSKIKVPVTFRQTYHHEIALNIR